MTQPSFYWHDYETWGANPRADRPAQFAGIRTDMDLNIIDDPLMIYARPTADFLPHPEAVMITGITPQLADAKGLNEADFFQRIHQQLSRAGTCTVGYNSIRFDDEVTRFGFYRNFYDPYAYSWQNGNSRWDVLDLMRITHALRPDGIHWPINEQGHTSFRLTDLTAANGIEQVGAHDALVDVKATIAIARLVKQQQPRLFDFYYALRHKQRAAELLKLNRAEIVLHVSGMFPAQQGCLAPIFPLLAHPGNSNEIICYNLRFNPELLLQLSVDEIGEKLYKRTLDLDEGEQRLPLKGVHLNKSPALAPVSTLTAAEADKWGVDWSVIQTHLEILMSDSDLVKRLQQVYSNPREYDEPDVDSALYQGFISRQDRQQCDQLLTMSAQQLAEWPVDSFQDQRLQTLLFRYRARNYPQTLSAEDSLRWQRFCQSRLVDGEFGATLTAEQFQQHLLTLAQREQGDDAQKLLNQLSLWAQSLFS